MLVCFGVSVLPSEHLTNALYSDVYPKSQRKKKEFNSSNKDPTPAHISQLPLYLGIVIGLSVSLQDIRIKNFQDIFLEMAYLCSCLPVNDSTLIIEVINLTLDNPG